MRSNPIKVASYIYNKLYDQVLIKIIPRQELFQEIIDNLLIGKRGDKCLDAGCGSRDFISLLKKYLDPENIIGIDKSSDHLEKSQKRHPNVSFKRADLKEQLPFSENSFEYITCINVLYLIDEFVMFQGYKMPQAIIEFYRVLKPGGRMVLVTPKVGYQPKNIFKEHLKKSIRAKGRIKTFAGLVVYFMPAIIVLLTNYYFIEQGKKQRYYFYKKEELQKYFNIVGFKKVSATFCYSGQNIMITAVK